MCFYGGPYVETKNQSAILNTNVTLECSLINSSDSISTIIWYKNDTRNKVAVAHRGQSSAQPAASWSSESNYQDQFKVTQDQMKTSNLTIVKTTKNDSCCFICKFQCGRNSTRPDFSNTTCLTVYAPLTAYISKLNDSSNITCTATSYPPPTVTWIGATTTMNDTRITSNNNGTVSVESTLVIGSEDINVTCEVKHLENTTLISWSDHHKGHVSVSLIEVLFLSNSASVVSVGILIVLIVMIIILVYYKLIRKPGDLIRLYS
uniref:Glycoprotein vOX2-2 n=2 Tax=Elephant endotheliotropic herpesvirus 1A TaxID=759753 RepID=A0A1L3HP23_ELHV1|nr:glycoprotein vOX2-2 [Elephant endotheliotropic herpesvirus 1A]AYC62777.1 glycoprotein vOX2-2 [Elephant endotheliotropic herpesvirus 1A]AYC62797.1 glycoprotein vOX2-2 [Elephant endotheliotropic herpesvirus 1A]